MRFPIIVSTLLAGAGYLARPAARPAPAAMDGGSATCSIARHLGYDVKFHDGSFQDWMQRTLPVRTGETP